MIILQILWVLVSIILWSLAAILVMVLFIPFQYLSRGSLYGGEGGAAAMVLWLFGAIRFRYSYNSVEGQSLDLRLMGLYTKRFHYTKDATKKNNEPEKESKIKKPKKPSGPFTLKMVHVILRSVKSIIARYKPRHLMVDATIGFEDAYHTGLMCASLSALSSLIPKESAIHIQPEFNDEVYEGRYETKGHITVIYLVWEALRVFFSKPFRMSRKAGKTKKVVSAVKA